MLLRPSTTISFQMLARPERMAWVTSSPSNSLRSRSPSRPETTSRRPSGSQSMLNGNEMGAHQSHDTGDHCLNKGVARPHQDHHSKHFIPKEVAPSLNGDH